MPIFPEITVDFYPDYCEFQAGNKKIRMENYIYLDPDHHTPMALGEKLNVVDGVELHLFNLPEQMPAGTDVFEYLKMYMSLAVKLLFIEHYFPGPGPLFVFRGADRLQMALKGYHRFILAHAAREAGARAVSFK